MKRLLSLLVILVLTILTLAGCGNSNDSSTKPGKHMGIGLFWFGDSLDPANEWDGWTVQRIGAGETLVTVSKDMKFEPQLADRWEVVNDTTWKFHIRDNVKFSNGNPVTAEAVKASLERSMEKNKRAKESAKIASMTANGQELTIVTTEPHGSLLATITEPVYIIVDVKAVDDIPVTTGPYKVSKFEKNNSIEVERNDNYWDGKAALDTITFKNLEDNSKRAMALQSGELDMIQNIDAANIALFKDTGKFTIHKAVGVRTLMLTLNLNEGPFQNPNLRKALSFALDREKLASLIGPGASATGAPFPPTTNYGYDKLPKPVFDIAQAEALIQAAGYTTKNTDGYYIKDGKPLTLVFATYGTLTPLYEAIQAELKNVGIKVDFKRVQSREDASMQGGTGFDMLENNYVSAATNDSLWFVQQMFASDGKGNKGKYSNPQVDTLIAQLAASFDVKERERLTFEIEQLVLQDNPDVFIAHPANILVSKNSVKNVLAHPLDYYLVTKDLTIEK